MADSPLRGFFLQPACPRQRQYEALRAVFVDGLSQKEAAQRFGYSYGAFRLLVGQFRSDRGKGSPPPFSNHPSRAACPAQQPLHWSGRLSRPSRTDVL